MVIPTHLPPPVITDSTADLAATTHMFCCSYMFTRRRFLRERPGQHEFGLEHCAGCLDPAVQRCGHPAERRMPDLPLDIGDDPPSIGLIPTPI
jgi:hypothetical protein